MIEQEKRIKQIVQKEIISLALRFEKKHKKDFNNPKGKINLKKNDPFSAALGKDYLITSSISRSLDSMIGSSLGKIAYQIAELFFEKVSKNVGTYIVDICVYEKNKYYLIEIKKGGDLDVKKADSEKKHLIKVKNYLLKKT